MNRLLLGLLVLFGLGVLTMLLYSAAWRCRPRLRHIVCWPVVMGCMFWGFRLPSWLKPAQSSVDVRKLLKGR